MHPGAGTRRARSSHALPGKIAGGDPERPGIVHRLDRDTSGLMVVARSEEAHARLQELVRERGARADLPRARPRPAAFAHAGGSRRRSAATAATRRASRSTRDSPRDAVTHFEVERLWPEHALLRVQLETGRMHQIRVHLAAIDLPVVGDPIYGVAGRGLGRQFLHAAELAFPHPFTRRAHRDDARSCRPTSRATWSA